MIFNRRFLAATATLFLAALSNLTPAAEQPSNIPYEKVEVLPAITSVGAICSEDSCQTTINPTFNVFVPQLCPGFEFSAGVLLLQPGADNLGYATVTTFRNPTVPVPIASPLWNVQTLDPDCQPGFRLAARWIFPNSGNDFQISWDDLRTKSSDSVTVDNPTQQWVSPFCQTGPPNPADPTEIGVFNLKSAQGQVKFAYDVVNLDFGQFVNLGSNMQLRIFTGLSFVRLQEQLVSTFYVTPPPPPLPDPLTASISLNNTSTYEGLGPRVGFKYTYGITGGFNFVSQLAGALLVGRMQPAEYGFTGISHELATGREIVNTEQIGSDRVTQVVYSCDAKIGISYSCLFCNDYKLHIEAGFNGAMYIHPFSTYETSTNVLPLEIGSLSTNSMRHTPSNFWANGYYLTGALKW